MKSPAPSRRRPTVVLYSAPGTLSGVDVALRREGVRPIRLTSLEPRPVSPERWIGRVLRVSAPDTVVVTSRAAVAAGVLPWRRAHGPRRGAVEFWAVGPGTARALRAAGIPRVRAATHVGADALGPALDRGSPRSILYFRSHEAGPGFARALRRRGHRVLDPVVYEAVSPSSFPASGRRALTRADLLVVTSPSGLTELKRRMDRPSFAHLARETPTVVLGERSLRKAQEYGFRRASIAPATAAQRFTRHLLGELRHARA